MSRDYAIVYGIVNRELVRLASCSNFVDAVFLYYLNPVSCYIVYRHREYWDKEVSRFAEENKSSLLDFFMNSYLYDLLKERINFNTSVPSK